MERLRLFSVIGVFFIISLPCVLVWAIAGVKLKSLIASDRQILYFGRIMCLLLLSVIVLGAHEAFSQGLGW
jgi:hypothetical protein